MDTLKLEIYKASLYTEHTADMVRILVNDQDLLELITEVEVGERLKFYEERMAKGEYPGKFNPKEQYFNGLAPDYVFFPSRRFLGDDEATGHEAHHSNGKVAIFECTCGEEGCGSVAVRITVSTDIVVWDAFENHWATEHDLSQIGPFVFDRIQYFEALSAFNPERMKMKMSELCRSQVRKAAVFDIEQYYPSYANSKDYFEVWTDLQTGVATIYFVEVSWREVRKIVGDRFHKPENVLEEIVKYAKRLGYSIEIDTPANK